MQQTWRDGLADDIAADLARLLRLGQPSKRQLQTWPDYVALHRLTAQHVDGLIRMACDPALQVEAAGRYAIWAPLHAWRALGQLRAEAAVAPLLGLLAGLDPDESAELEIPTVFGLIGAPAMPALGAALADPATGFSPAAAALAGLAEIGTGHPDHRDECIELILRVLAPREGGDPALAGLAVGALLDLRAVDSIDAIRDAFRRDAVDLAICGDLEDVEIDMGVREHRDTPRPHYGQSAMENQVFRDDPPIVQYVREGPKVGRNDPCPCGSGKKYKKCCLV